MMEEEEEEEREEEREEGRGISNQCAEKYELQFRTSFMWPFLFMWPMVSPRP